MEASSKQDQEESQGKRSTAETDVTYNQDTEELRNSTTTTMSEAVSGTASADGTRVEAARENDTSNSPETDK